jgi:hypothetical protein
MLKVSRENGIYTFYGIECDAGDQNKGRANPLFRDKGITLNLVP